MPHSARARTSRQKLQVDSNNETPPAVSVLNGSRVARFCGSGKKCGLQWYCESARSARACVTGSATLTPNQVLAPPCFEVVKNSTQTRRECRRVNRNKQGECSSRISGTEERRYA